MHLTGLRKLEHSIGKRARWIEHARIRRRQRALLASFPRRVEWLVIVLAPGHDVVGGGVLSISSIVSESAKLLAGRDAAVILCTYPGDPPLLRYTRFRNDHGLFEVGPVLRHFDRVGRLTLHVPEHAIARLLRRLPRDARRRLRRIPAVHVNILLQNIRLIEDQPIERLKELGLVTCTTAHERYTSPDTGRRLGVSLHKLSVHVSPEKYVRRPYRSKRDILVVSADRHPRKEEFLARLAEALPALEVRIVSEMTYEDYRALIEEAKWSVTFGEGLDGYFVEPVFSGSVAFAVYNDEFFTDDFRALETVYGSYDEMFERFIADVRRLDRDDLYAECNRRMHALCSKYYDHGAYVDNLRRFYETDFTRA